MKRMIGLILTGCLLMGCSKEVKKEEVVACFDAPIGENSIWCGSFNIVWDELKEKYNDGSDIVFTDGNNALCDQLNQSAFTKDDISKSDYYVISGYKTPELKEEIETNIQDKFNQTSDVLDRFTFQEDSKNLFLYAMLYKNFEFEMSFDEMEGTFKGKTCDYFGTTNGSMSQRSQIDVLYYKDEEHFCVQLNTKGLDKVIVCQGVKGNTFQEMYENIMKESDAYTGFTSFEENDSFCMPKLNVNVEKEYTDLCGHPFTLSSLKEEYTIDQTIQTIQFQLDEKGGEVKSEAAMDARMTSLPIEMESRRFVVDDDFVLYLVEQDKEVPYLAMQVNEIQK